MTVSKKPLVYVVMACYNDGKTIGDAIDSIIGQTYDNWKFVIVNDASTDNSLAIIESYTDSRITVITNKVNQGLAKSLNVGMSICNNADYIARLDSDDISLPNRIEKQVLYMEEHQDVSICGSNIEMFDGVDGSFIYRTKIKESNDYLMAQMPFCPPIPHPTWLIRKKDFEFPLYDEEYRSSQDYEFMSRLLGEDKQVACVQDALVKYRVRQDSISHRIKGVDPNTLKVQCKITKMLGMDLEPDQVNLANRAIDCDQASIKLFFRFCVYCVNIFRANKKSKLFDQKALCYTLTRQMYGALLSTFRKQQSKVY